MAEEDRKTPHERAQDAHERARDAEKRAAKFHALGQDATHRVPDRAVDAHESALDAHKQAAELHEDAATLQEAHAEHSRQQGNIAQAKRAEELANRERELQSKAVQDEMKERDELARDRAARESKKPKR